MARGTRGTPHPRLPNVRVDAFGLSARVFAKGAEREKRYPPNTPDDVIERWQAKTHSALLDKAALVGMVRSPKLRGTLTADAAAYLKRREGRDGYKSDRSHLKAWTKSALGKKHRGRITQTDCENLIATWRTAGRKEKTIRHRVRVLKELWHALDGVKASTPADGIKLPKPDRSNPQHVTADVIRAVAQSLREGLTIEQKCGSSKTTTTVHRATSAKTYARFIVRALTGQRADQIMRAVRSDVDLVGRIWWVRPAKGGHAVPLPMNDEQIVAWRIFISADAWGAWDWNSFADVLRRHGWPKDIPPKNLRHSFAIDHLLAGTDLGDLQGLLGHASIQTTRDFYAPVLVSRLKAAVARRELQLVPGGLVPGETDGIGQFASVSDGAQEQPRRARRGLKSVKLR